MIMSMAMITVSIPRLGFYLGEKMKNEYENLLNSIFSYMSFLLFPLGIGFMILSKEIILLFGGEKYLAAYFAMVCFSIRFIVGTIQSFLSRQVLFVNKKENIVTLTFFICGIVNLILKIILLKFKILGASTSIITTGISEFIILILSYIYAQKYLNIKMSFFSLKNMKYLLYSLVFFTIKYFLEKLGLNLISRIFITIILSIITYFLILILTEDLLMKEALQKVREMINKKLGIV